MLINRKTDRQIERKTKEKTKQKEENTWYLLSDDFSMDKTFLLLFKTSYLSVRLG